MPSEETVEGGQRGIAEVLVVDRVELAVVDQILHVRHLGHHVRGVTVLGNALSHPMKSARPENAHHVGPLRHANVTRGALGATCAQQRSAPSASHSL